MPYPASSVRETIAVHSPGSLHGDVNDQRLCPGAGLAAGMGGLSKHPHQAGQQIPTRGICTPSYTSEALNQQYVLSRVS